MSRPKYPYIRSKALLAACRELPCQRCGKQDGTVVAAHSNQAAHGKGRAIKACDSRVAALCQWCHSQCDQGGGSHANRLEMWWAAHVKTVRELIRRGLWPVGVLIPDTRRFD